MPKLTKRTALLHTLKDIFRRFQSQPVQRVVTLINPILRGWVNYFRAGNVARFFGFVKEWVEQEDAAPHMMRARGRRGFGWKRWSPAWIYNVLRVFNGYRVQYQVRA